MKLSVLRRALTWLCEEQSLVERLGKKSGADEVRSQVCGNYPVVLDAYAVDIRALKLRAERNGNYTAHVSERGRFLKIDDWRVWPVRNGGELGFVGQSRSPSQGVSSALANRAPQQTATAALTSSDPGAAAE